MDIENLFDHNPYPTMILIGIILTSFIYKFHNYNNKLIIYQHIDTYY